jgi:hypothetical protein
VIHPIPYESLVAYWSGDLVEGEGDRIEEHLMSCDACTKAAARVAAIAEAIRTVLPPVPSHATLERARGRGLRVAENVIPPNVRTVAIFPKGADVLIHRLSADLGSFDRLSLEFQTPEGQTLLHFGDIPFDPKSGEVLVACHRHYQAMFPSGDVVLALRSAEGRTVGEYLVVHQFE